VLPKFHNIHKQEDAHEFLLNLLDKMDEAEKRVHRNLKYKTIIQQIFGGEVRQSITCEMEDCGHVSHTSQAFLDLSLDLLNRDRDIMSSLKDFTKQEILSHDNQYKCEKYPSTKISSAYSNLGVIPNPVLKRLQLSILFRQYYPFI
jgi:ubiquitin C-terminal hydrolase